MCGTPSMYQSLEERFFFFSESESLVDSSGDQHSRQCGHGVESTGIAERARGQRSQRIPRNWTPQVESRD